MNLDKSKLIENSNGEVEIMDIKLDPNVVEDLLQRNGFYPAYHMNKQHWISVLLDGTVAKDRVFDLIHMSFLATASALKKGEGDIG